MAEIPGSVAQHRWITDACREGKGDEGALSEALDSARESAERAMRGWDKGRGAKIHVVVTVERPGRGDNG